MPDPVTGGEGNQGGEGTRANKQITCEFCESRLTATGDGLRKSERMKTLLKSEDELTTAQGTITTLRQTIEDKNGEIERLKAENERLKTAPPVQVRQRAAHVDL